MLQTACLAIGSRKNSRVESIPSFSLIAIIRCACLHSLKSFFCSSFEFERAGLAGSASLAAEFGDEVAAACVCAGELEAFDSTAAMLIVDSQIVPTLKPEKMKLRGEDKISNRRIETLVTRMSKFQAITANALHEVV